MQNEIKERPILFSAPMVRAILEGQKTMTRRVAKPQPKMVTGSGKRVYESADFKKSWEDISGTGEGSGYSDCPYGKPGDRLVVKETSYAYGRWIKQFSATKNRDEWFFQDMTTLEGKAYKYADSPPENVEQKRVENAVGWHKRPSLFMPYYASRITLEITDVRVERLRDISEADAIAEGVESWVEDRMKSRPTHYKIYYQTNPKDPDFYSSTAKVSFETLWQSINGPESWEQNPFVWVIEFKRIAP